jgi:hypothetical protein
MEPHQQTDCFYGTLAWRHDVTKTRIVNRQSLSRCELEQRRLNGFGVSSAVLELVHSARLEIRATPILASDL